jgi:Ca-activated chloride channel family protein
MSFGSPLFLLALLAVPAVIAGYVWLERRRERSAATWAAPALVPNLVRSRPGRRRHIPVALFLVGVTLLLVGFARPQAKLRVAREGATVVLAFDISRSMEAKDVKPTRLKAARASALAFVNKLPSKYRVALVTFSDHVSVPVPPTYDRDKVRKALLLAPHGEGTALGNGIARSVAVAVRAVGHGKAGEAPAASILVISDGAQTQGRWTPQRAAALAKKDRVPVSTASIGTPRGVVTRKLPGGFTERTSVPPDPRVLAAVAKATGGRSFSATRASDLKAVYDDLGHRLAHVRKTREITAGFSFAALVLMLTGGALSGVWFRRLV